MAHAFTTVPDPFCGLVIGWTPQYPPSKKYRSTEGDGDGEASRKCALIPIQRSLEVEAQDRVAGLVRFDQRPAALITARASTALAPPTTVNGPVPSTPCTWQSPRASTPVTIADCHNAESRSKRVMLAAAGLILASSSTPSRKMRLRQILGPA